MYRVLYLLAIVSVALGGALHEHLSNDLRRKTYTCCKSECSREEITQLNQLLGFYETSGGNDGQLVDFTKYVANGGRCIASDNTRSRAADYLKISCAKGPHDDSAGPTNVRCTYEASIATGISSLSIYSSLYKGVNYFGGPSCYQYFSTAVTYVSGDCNLTLYQNSPNGNYTVTGYSYDPQSGYVYDTAYFLVKWTGTNDNAPPVLRSLSAPVSAMLSDGSFPIAVRATDNMSGVVSLSIQGYSDVGGSSIYGGWYGVRGSLLATLSTTVNVTIYPITPNGKYTLYAYVYDGVGWSMYYDQQALDQLGFSSEVFLLANDCPGGYSQPPNSLVACAPCPAGTFAPPGSYYCTACRPGSFTGKAGQSWCTQCPVGKYSPGGNVPCKNCQPGTYTNSNGTAVCAPCWGGYRSAGGATTCDPCAAGMYSCGGMAKCKLCPLGHYGWSGTPVCLKCAPGTYADTTGSGSCKTCAIGTYSSIGASTCTSCPASAPNTLLAGSNSVLSCMA